MSALRRLARHTLAALALAHAPCATLGAQDVRPLRVRAVEGATGAAVPGAILSLLGADGTRLGVALADAEGEAELRASGGVPVRVRAERVGFEGVTTPPLLADTVRATLRLEMSARRVRLAAVVVRESQRCAAGGAVGAQSAAVWDELRKALTSAVLSERSGGADALEARRYVRLLDRASRVEAETTHVVSRGSGAPFRTAAPAALSEHGFAVVDDEGATTYYAPDAALLISDEFVRDHCFGVVRRTRGDTTFLGLGFEPAPRRRVAEIAGVLWLDQATSELRALEYQYVQLPGDPPRDAEPGGRLEFAHLADGRWIVSRWHIRMPRVTILPAQRAGGLTVPRRTAVVGVREEGGVVRVSPSLIARSTDVRGAEPAVSTPPPASVVVSGFVFDSVRGVGLQGARVALEGTEVSGTTDRVGHYRLETPFAGDYTLAVSHERLAALGAPALTRPVTLTPGSPLRADVGGPSVEALRHRFCEAGADDDRAPRALVAGVVRDSVAGQVVPGAMVTLEWKRAVLETRGAAVAAGMVTDRAETRTDAGGFFAVCAAPTRSTIGVRVTSERGGAARTLTLHGELLIDASLAVAPAAEGRAPRDEPARR